MSEIVAGFDILGLGTLVGSMVFLGALIVVLWDNRSFDEVNRRHAAAAESATLGPKGQVAPAVGPVNRSPGASPGASPGTDDGSPGGPSRPKRAA